MADNPTLRFQTYLNYMTAIGDFLSPYDKNPKLLFDDVANGKVFSTLQKGNFGLHQEKIEKLLRNAWYTEINILLAGEMDDYINYSNLWSPIQLYYAVYLALRAYFLASGQIITDHHNTSLRAVANVITQRPSLFPYPWRVTCIDDPNLGKFSNLPSGILLNKISPLSSNHKIGFWNRYTMFLKTTRDRTLEDKCDDWKSNHKKKRISLLEKQKIIGGLAPTAIFDCLYRMRVRSNYIDADAFLLSIQSSDESTQFHQALRKVTWYMLFTLELLIAKHVGKKNFNLIIESFRTPNTAYLIPQTVGGRWEIIQKLF